MIEGGAMYLVFSVIVIVVVIVLSTMFILLLWTELKGKHCHDRKN